jgi:3-oxoacyl-[acyl-carrier-protein] synthase II
VVITGLGIVAPGGIGKEAFWETIKAGKSTASRITSFDASSYPTQIATEVKDFEPTNFMDPKTARRTERYSQFALAAARMAIEDSRLKIDEVNSDRIGVLDGTNLGNTGWNIEQGAVFMEKGYHRLHPLSAVIGFSGASASVISRALNVHGPSLTYAGGCAASSVSVGYGFKAIGRYELDIVIAGGSDAPIFPIILASYCRVDALSKRNDQPEKASRPFDKARDGFVLGEGAGMVVVEELQHALQRNAKIYAEVLGFYTNCDAYHATGPHPKGTYMAKAMEMALKDANVSPEAVDYINAHGTSTPLNDKTETLAIKRIFGQHAKKIPISSTKSMIGHLQGACGSVELIACILSMNSSFIHPTINYEHSDPECDLDYVPNRGRHQELNIAISNSFGFGGKNSCIVIGKFKG